MSKGRHRITVRIGEETLAAIQAELAIRHAQSCTVAWTVADWIRSAIDAKIAHSRRGRAKRTPPKKKNPSRVSVDNAGGS